MKTIACLISLLKLPNYSLNKSWKKKENNRDNTQNLSNIFIYTLYSLKIIHSPFFPLIGKCLLKKLNFIFYYPPILITRLKTPLFFQYLRLVINTHRLLRFFFNNYYSCLFLSYGWIPQLYVRLILNLLGHNQDKNIEVQSYHNFILRFCWQSMFLQGLNLQHFLLSIKI